ncbi:hypothetical protein [Streptomyces sp. NPDC048606]|uniref:hypothetical protein n=1 Tax=Streptomyces sp. NPDC048606 TaxID=3154726 RepID=UPI00343F1A40
MRTTRTVWGGAGAALALAAGLVVVGPAGSAAATAADCANGANGFVDISDDLSGRVARSVDMGHGRTLTLQYGSVNGAERGWAKLGGSTQNGDLVWMDWTNDGGRTWLQCGPFAADRGAGRSKTSAAKTTSSAATYKFRACARLTSPDVGRCTTWW